MNFDWQQFLEKNNIEYVERGPSTAKGNIYTHCPFCGDADQGHHMGLSLKGKGWGCWKETTHRGKSPIRLVQAYLGCSWPEATVLVTEGRGLVRAEGFMHAVTLALGFGISDEEYGKTLKFPKSFRPMTTNVSAPYAYLRHERDFTKPEIAQLIDTFDLHLSLTEEWWGRVIVPIYDEKMRLVTWTGRSTGQKGLRYKTLTNDPEKADGGLCAKGPITDYFLRMGQMMLGGQFLVLCEGPFDAMRLALDEEIYEGFVTCLFGKVISPTQLDFLAGVRSRYRAIFILLDPDASFSALQMSSHLIALGVQPFFLKQNKDPGELNSKEVCALFEELQERVA